MTADDLVRSLAEKHRDDVFVAECKSGPTTAGLTGRLNAAIGDLKDVVNAVAEIERRAGAEGGGNDRPR